MTIIVSDYLEVVELLLLPTEEMPMPRDKNELFRASVGHSPISTVTCNFRDFHRAVVTKSQSL